MDFLTGLIKPFPKIVTVVMLLGVLASGVLALLANSAISPLASTHISAPTLALVASVCGAIASFSHSLTGTGGDPAALLTGLIKPFPKAVGVIAFMGSAASGVLALLTNSALGPMITSYVSAPTLALTAAGCGAIASFAHSLTGTGGKPPTEA